MRLFFSPFSSLLSSNAESALSNKRAAGNASKKG